MGAERDQIMEIATLILPWCRDGNYGSLSDGTSNLSLAGKGALFELGSMWRNTASPNNTPCKRQRRRSHTNLTKMAASFARMRDGKSAGVQRGSAILA